MADLNNNSKCSGPAGMAKVGKPGAYNVGVTRMGKPEGKDADGGAVGPRDTRRGDLKMGGSKGSRGSTGPTNSPNSTNNLKKK